MPAMFMCVLLLVLLYQYKLRKIEQEEQKKDTKDGFMFLEPDCIGCFGASENQCERCEEKRHDKKTETLAD